VEIPVRVFQREGIRVHEKPCDLQVDFCWQSEKGSSWLVFVCWFRFRLRDAAVGIGVF
jgi:hypothetical protein